MGGLQDGRVFYLNFIPEDKENLSLSEKTEGCFPLKSVRPSTQDLLLKTCRGIMLLSKLLFTYFFENLFQLKPTETKQCLYWEKNK